MKQRLIILLCLTLAVLPTFAVTDLRVENMTNPLGIATTLPRFSWRIATAPAFSNSRTSIVQTAYRLLVASSPALLKEGHADLWDSGLVSSDQQLWVSYGGHPLQAGQQVYWTVKVVTAPPQHLGPAAASKGTRGAATAEGYAAPQHFSIGLLTETQWHGRWIGLEELQPGEQRGLHTRLAARYLRRTFTLPAAPIRRATAYVAGLGLYEFFVNGQRQGGNHVLQPVPSDYRRSVYYNTYDITKELQATANGSCHSGSAFKSNTSAGQVTLALILGNGHYFPPRQNKPYKTPVFGLPKCRVNVVIETADGQTTTWVTDETWRLTANGPIRSNNEYDGETYDARLEQPGWLFPAFCDTTWQPAQRSDIPEGTLRPQMTEGMTEALYGPPVSLAPLESPVSPAPSVSPVSPARPARPRGTLLLDFGQNLAGWVGIKVRGHRGDTIRIRYAERLDSTGHLYVANLRDAESEDIYVCNGTEQGREWRPRFSFHGFRYVSVTGMPDATRDDFRAYVVADEMRPTGHLTTSDSTLNRVLRAAWWGIRDNYKGMPVDCPQRNERQPWLGDRTVGCLGESFLFDNERLYTKWMADLVDGQRSDGALSNVTPAFWRYFDDNVTWPAVFPFACDMLLEQYGNRQPIFDSYPALKRWIAHILDNYLHDGIVTKDKYGDWCLPPERLDLIHSEDPARQTDGRLLSTAYMVRILGLMEKFAHLQQLHADAADWHVRRIAMADAFNRAFLTCRRGTSPRPDHVLYPDSVFYGNNTATANLLPLAFGIVPDSVRADVVKNLVAALLDKDHGIGHVTCGVIGISWLLRTLSDNGYADAAWQIATQHSYPSWGYMVDNGATTIWELWNGDKANPKMNSGNHVMLLGDLITWAYQYLAGLRTTDAYHHIRLQPSFDIRDCFSVDASYDSPYGTIRSAWHKTPEHLHWEVTIPAGTTATLVLPDGEERQVGSGSHVVETAIATADRAIIADEFLYEHAPFPQAHAATIVERQNGDLVVAYFGGTKEKNPDVCIWVSRKVKGSKGWTIPQRAADGLLPEGQKACWNPVLTEMPDGELWLFYKIGATVNDWQGYVVRSRDGGRTWSPREMLPKGFLGPVKNKPLLLDGSLICGSSTEKDGWRFHVEIYDLRTRQWLYVGPVPSTVAMKTDDCQQHPIDCIQPSLLQLKDGRLMVLMRTHNAFLAQSFSSDGGQTWTPVTLSTVPNNQSGTDAVTLRDGRQALIYNNFQTIAGQKKGPRSPLSIALSDDGATWRHVLTLEASPVGEYSYPAIIQGRDGTLHCVYTWRRDRIAYKQIDLSRIKE